MGQTGSAMYEAYKASRAAGQEPEEPGDFDPNSLLGKYIEQQANRGDMTAQGELIRFGMSNMRKWAIVFIVFIAFTLMMGWIAGVACLVAADNDGYDKAAIRNIGGITLAFFTVFDAVLFYGLWVMYRYISDAEKYLHRHNKGQRADTISVQHYDHLAAAQNPPGPKAAFHGPVTTGAAGAVHAHPAALPTPAVGGTTATTPATTTVATTAAPAGDAAATATSMFF